jgi:peptide/nickel transport system substrate-binding protein
MKLRYITRRKFLRLSAISATGILAAACVAPSPGTSPTSAADATAPAAAEASKAGTLTFGYAQKTSVDHFFHMRDMAGGTDIYCRRFANAKLLTADGPMTGYEPDLAESWALSEDQLTLTFNLRPGLTWHDGEAFSAEDVAFTWKMMSLPGLGGNNLGTPFVPHIVGLQEWMDGTAEEVAGIHVVDDNTVAFDLIAPASLDLLELLFDAVCIAPEHVLADYLDRERAPEILQSEWATTASHIGLGPFRVVEYVADQYIIYEPFENYHRGKPVLEKLIYQPYADGQTLVAALETQEVDVGRIPDTEYARFQELDFLRTQIDQSGWVLSTPFNTRRPYLADKRVRQALLYAIDRQAITETVYKGVKTPLETPVYVPQYGVSPNLMQYDYDPEKAKTLLAEAGWDANQKLRWLVGTVPTDESLFAAINSYWAAVGVQAEYQIVGQDFTAATEEGGWDFDLSWSAYWMGHPALLRSVFVARDCTALCIGYEETRYDELFDLAMQPLPAEEMKEVIWELQEIVADEALFLTLSRASGAWAVNDRVTGLENLVYGLKNNWNLESVQVAS